MPWGSDASYLHQRRIRKETPRGEYVLDSVCDNRITGEAVKSDEFRVKSVSMIAAGEPAVKPTAIHTVLRERKECRD